MNYQNGKIYRLDCNITGEVYIGSTTQPTVAKRLAEHVSGFKFWKSGKRNNVTSYQIIERGNYKITMIEAHPCNSKDELTAREGYFIRTIDCVNKNIAGRTAREYQEENKERLKQSYVDNKEYRLDIMHTYYEANKTEIRAKQNEYKKEYYLKNKEKIKQKRLKKLQENADPLD